LFLIEALKKLSMDNLSNLTPHPLKVFLSYSHPPVLDRIQALRKTPGAASPSPDAATTNPLITFKSVTIVIKLLGFK
jgi:hypothetical protein